MPSSRLGCPLSLKTPNMGNPGYNRSPIPTIGGKGYEKPFQARRMMYTTIALVGPLTHRSGGSIDEIHD